MRDFRPITALVMLLALLLAPAWSGAAQAYDTTTAPLAPVIAPVVAADLLVLGAEPEGIAAAVAGARAGLSVVLIDARDRVGGLFTVGQLAALDLNTRHSTSLEPVNQGFFSEFHAAVGRSGGFDLEVAQAFFDKALAKAGVQVYLNRIIRGPLMDGTHVLGVDTIGTAGAPLRFLGRRIIDATADAEVAVAAGAPYVLGRADLGLPGVYAAAGLVFRLAGVEWETVTAYLNRRPSPLDGADANSAWGYRVMRDYQAKSPNLQIRELNLARQNDGTVLVNALHLFDFDPADPVSRQWIRQRVRDELPGIIAFMQANCPGFAGASLVGLAPELYVREFRHLRGLRTVRAEDVFQQRIPSDTVALGSYPVDLQPARKGERAALLSRTGTYGIPIGALVPQKLDNVLVVGKSASFDAVAFGSARTVPVGMAAGQAAGVAAALSLMAEASFADLSGNLPLLGRVQTMLRRQGVKLDAPPPELPEMASWAFPHLQWLRDRGLISKFAHPDYALDEPATVAGTLAPLLRAVAAHTPLAVSAAELLRPYSDPVTTATLLRLAGDLLGSPVASLDVLREQGILDERLYARLTARAGELTNAEVYALMAGVLSRALNEGGRT